MGSVEKALTLEGKKTWGRPIDFMGWNVTDLLPILLMILWPINPATSEARGHTVRIQDENAHLSTCKKL